MRLKKTPNIANLATSTALAGVVIYSKKTDYNTNINETENKITDHYHDKYIAT